MKIVVAGSPVLLTENNHDDMKQALFDALDNCGFTINSIFPTWHSPTFSGWAKEWAAENSKTINDLVESEEISFNGAIPPGLRAKVKANKADLAFVALWDGSSSGIGGLVKLCNIHNVDKYVTNGKVVLGV